MKCQKCNGKGYIITKEFYSRSRKNFDTLEEAEKFKSQQDDRDKLDIQQEPPVYARCQSYCRVSQFCPVLKREGVETQNKGEEEE